MAQSDYQCPTCASCDELSLPNVSFDDCRPLQLRSEINKIYMAIEDPDNPGEALNGPTDWTSTVDWAAAIDNELGTNVHELTVIGDLPEPEQEIRIVSDNRRVMSDKTFNLNATVDDTNDVNYNALRALECGHVVRIWYTTLGGKLYGGQEGIRASITKANAPLDRGQNTYERFEFGFLWVNTCHPERIDNPIGAPLV